MALGDYSPTAWVNGTAPAISASNLLNIENKVDELDNYAGNNRGILSLTVTSANVTLSAAQALNDVIICSGTLTGNRSVIIPSGIKKPYKIIIKNINKYYIRFITASPGLYFDAYGLTTGEAAIRSSYSFDIITDGTNVYGDEVPPLVRAEYSNCATTAAATNLIYQTKVLDTHSAYNSSTGEYICPIAGIYQIDADWLGSAPGNILIQKNGSMQRAIQTPSSSRCFGVVTISCIAGDVLRLRTESGTVAANIGTYLNITRIGS